MTERIALVGYGYTNPDHEDESTPMMQVDPPLLEALFSLVESLLWPTVVIFFLIRFDDEIVELLKNLKSVKVGSVELGLDTASVAEVALNLGLAEVDEDETAEERTRKQVRAREILSETLQAASRDTFQRLSRAKLLWVNDDPFANQFERDALESFGIHITTSTSTSDALERIKRERFDVIVSDMDRPTEPYDLAGYALLEAQRTLGDTTPFVIYTGTSTPEFKEEARRNGAFGHTNRPEEMFRLVRQAIVQ